MGHSSVVLASSLHAWCCYQVYYTMLCLKAVLYVSYHEAHHFLILGVQPRVSCVCLWSSTGEESHGGVHFFFTHQDPENITWPFHFIFYSLITAESVNMNMINGWRNGFLDEYALYLKNKSTTYCIYAVMLYRLELFCAFAGHTLSRWRKLCFLGW